MGHLSGASEAFLKHLSDLAPQTSNDAKQQALNQSKDEVQLKGSS